MVKTNGNISSKESDSVKSEAADFKRRDGLVDAAIKASKDSFPAIRRGFAAAIFYMVETGRPSLMNKLFVGMERKDSLGMVSLAMRRVLDVYAADGKRDENDASKWIVRPTPIWEFRANPSKETPGEHFRMVHIKDGTKLNAAQVKAVKATKRAILAAGEDALADSALWSRSDAFTALEQDFTINAFHKALQGLLLKAAKSGHKIGLTQQEIIKIGKDAHLPTDTLTTIRDSYNDGESHDDDETETTPEQPPVTTPQQVRETAVN
jgi:hypothetical protein